MLYSKEVFGKCQDNHKAKLVHRLTKNHKQRIKYATTESHFTSDEDCNLKTKKGGTIINLQNKGQNVSSKTLNIINYLKYQCMKLSNEKT